jgi:hypothetical protein
MWTARTWESNILRNKTFCSKEFPVTWNLVAGHDEHVPWTKLSSGLDVITSSGLFMAFLRTSLRFVGPILYPTPLACSTRVRSKLVAPNIFPHLGAKFYLQKILVVPDVKYIITHLLRDLLDTGFC